MFGNVVQKLQKLTGTNNRMMRTDSDLYSRPTGAEWLSGTYLSNLPSRLQLVLFLAQALELLNQI